MPHQILAHAIMLKVALVDLEGEIIDQIYLQHSTLMSQHL